MDRHRSSLIIVIVVFFVMFMLFMCLFVDRMAGESQRRRQNSEFESLITKADSYDFHIYWIGEVPEGLDRLGDKLSIIVPRYVSDDTMPVPWGDLHFTSYNENGDIMDDIEPREYAEHMLIVVSDGAALTDEQYETVRRCTVENDVPVLLFGDSIPPFREMMLLYAGTYDSDDSMSFSASGGAVDDVIKIEGAKTDTSLAAAILEYAYDLFDSEAA